MHPGGPGEITRVTINERGRRIRVRCRHVGVLHVAFAGCKDRRQQGAKACELLLGLERARAWHLPWRLQRGAWHC